MPFQENLREFSERHGNQAVTMVEGYLPSDLLFPSGAVSRRDGRPFDQPALIDPPKEGTIENLQRKVLYWETRTRLGEEAFTATKQRALGMIQDFNQLRWRPEI